MDIYNYSCEKPHLSQCIAICLKYISRKTTSYLYSHIDSVDLVMFVERSLRHQETHAKNTKSSKSFLYHVLEFFRPGFWIPTKGILSHTKMDWTCPDFTQGSNIELAIGHSTSCIVFVPVAQFLFIFPPLLA